MRKNRWNSVGTQIIYCADSRALAFSELSIYLTMVNVTSAYVMLTIKVEDYLPIFIFEENKLPHNWNTYPHLIDTQIIGDQFIKENKFALMKVPSAIVHGDYNYLINPKHQDFKQIQVVDKSDFPIDKRVFE